MIHHNILLIGTRDQGQATGISQMFELLIQGFSLVNYPYIVIDLTLGTPSKKSGSINIKRIIKILGAILRYYFELPKSDAVYLTVGVSRLGFIRDFLILWPAFLTNKKTHIHVHSGGYGDFFNSQLSFFRFLIKQTLDRVDNIIVLGNLLKEQFNFVDKYERKIHVVKNALPPGLSLQNVAIKNIDGEAEKRILYLSNMIESKGFLDVLEACRILRYELGIRAIFNFCGGFRSTVSDSAKYNINSLEDFREILVEKKITDDIIYHGIVSGQEKQRLLEQSHILILPTYYAPEGQPACIIEALAFATPVITTKFRGIPEEIIDGFNGFFVDPKSPEQIANKISVLLNNPDLYREMSKNSLHFYLKNFTPNAHYEQIMPLLTR